MGGGQRGVRRRRQHQGRHRHPGDELDHIVLQIPLRHPVPRDARGHHPFHPLALVPEGHVGALVVAHRDPLSLPALVHVDLHSSRLPQQLLDHRGGPLHHRRLRGHLVGVLGHHLQPQPMLALMVTGDGVPAPQAGLHDVHHLAQPLHVRDHRGVVDQLHPRRLPHEPARPLREPHRSPGRTAQRHHRADLLREVIGDLRPLASALPRHESSSRDHGRSPTDAIRRRRVAHREDAHPHARARSQPSDHPHVPHRLRLRDQTPNAGIDFHMPHRSLHRGAHLLPFHFVTMTAGHRPPHQPEGPIPTVMSLVQGRSGPTPFHALDMGGTLAAERRSRTDASDHLQASPFQREISRDFLPHFPQG